MYGWVVRLSSLGHFFFVSTNDFIVRRRVTETRCVAGDLETRISLDTPNIDHIPPSALIFLREQVQPEQPKETTLDGIGKSFELFVRPVSTFCWYSIGQRTLLETHPSVPAHHPALV